MATLTTTGFGDIVLPGPWGRLLSIGAMLVGVTLFVRPGQTRMKASTAPISNTVGLSS